MGNLNKKQIEKLEEKIGSIFLIAIGIDDYKLKGDRLDNCCTDAEMIYKTFSSNDYFRLNPNSLLITSEKSKTDKSSLLASIGKCDEYIDDYTNIIFYYSGHGCNSEGVFHFFVTDSVEPDIDLLSVNEVIDELNKLNGGRRKSITLFIDACQTIINHSKGLNTFSFKMLKDYIDKVKGLGVIYSCEKGESSLDAFNKENMSVFTKLLIQALNGCVEALDGNYLTFSKMYDYLKNESEKISKENAQINQHPQILFSGNDIIYARISDDKIRHQRDEIIIPQYDDIFMDLMYNLANICRLLTYGKDILLSNSEELYEPGVKEKLIREVCADMSGRELLTMADYSIVITQAFFYWNELNNASADQISTSTKKKIVSDLEELVINLDNIYDEYIDHLYS